MNNIFPFCVAFFLVSVSLSGDEIWEDFSHPESFQSRAGAKVISDSGPENGMKAIRIAMPGAVYKKWDAPKKESIERNRSKGIQFRVKGDGSSNYGTLAVWETYTLTYVCVFPLRDLSWKTYTVAWEDFLIQGNPIAYDPRPFPETGTLPGAFRGIELSSLRKFKKEAPAKYSIADLRFVDHASPSILPCKILPLQSVRRKLKQKQPVKIICMGSFSQAFAKKIEDDLKKRTGGNQIFVEIMNPDAKIEWDTANLSMIPEKSCDLFLYMPGGQEKLYSLPSEIVELHIFYFIKRFASITKGNTALMVFPPLPCNGNRKDFLEDYEKAIISAVRKSGSEMLLFPENFKKKRESLIHYSSAYHPQLNASGIFSLSEAIIDQLTKE